MKPKPNEKALRCQEYYDALINALRYVAYRGGYAIAVHGSLKRDIDLVACPWRENPITPNGLISNIQSICEQVIGFGYFKEGDKQPETKPCGRLAYTIYLEHGEDSIYLDISVMPEGK